MRLALIALPALALAACSGGSGSSGGNPPVSGTNHAPVAVTDVVDANGGTLMIPVLINDYDPDGDVLSIVLVNAPGHGTTTVSDAGTPADGRDDFVVYTPATGYTGADSFSYTVTDGSDGRATGDVQIMAIPALNALDKSVATPMGTPVAIDVLEHPTVGILSATVPAFGSATIDDGGTPADMTDDYLVYTPVAGYTGPDTFFYMLTDPTGTDMAAVNIDVTGSPTPPAPPNVHGQVVKGLVRDALVQLYAIGADGNRVGVPVAATTTDAQGRWGLTLPASRPALLVVASGGRYEDEVRSTPSRTIDLQATDKLVAVLPGDEDFVVSSIYANALYLRARHAAGSSGFEAAYTAARADSLTAWGFDISATEAADPALPSPVLPGVSRTHALALGGAATALDRIVTALGLAEPNGTTIAALIADLAECTLDGNGFDGVIEVNVDGVDDAILDDLDLDLEILRFRNNNFSAYSGTPLATWNATACTVVEPPADNQPPVVSIGPQHVSSLSPALSGSIDDPAAVVRITVAGQTYDAVNNGGSWQLDAGIISPALSDGAYEVLVQAFDVAGNIGTDATSVELIIDSTAPVVTLDTLHTEDTSPALSGTVDDPGATVTVSVAGVDYAAIVAGTNWSLPAGSISPALAEGAYLVTVTATDSFANVGIIGVASALTVSVNDPPSFAISGDITADENFTGARLVTVVPDPVPADETGQVVTYSLNPAAGDFADVTIDANTGTVFITALPDAFGSQVFTIIADDGQPAANFASRSFTLTVNAVNNPPAFVVSGDIAENQDFAGVRTVAVTPLAVPPDEVSQTVSYSLSPASVAFADIVVDPATGAVSITAVAGATGNQLFTLSADDGQSVNNTASAMFTLTVNSTVTNNVVPIITGQALLGTPEEVSLPVTLADLAVTDPDNSYPADFTLSVQPGANYSVIANTITPAVDFVGSLVVPVTVNDGASGSAVYNLDVTVSAVNDTPAFAVSGNVVENEDFVGSRVVTVTPGPVPADETGQIVTYGLSPASVGFANVALDPATGTVTITPIADQIGSQVFTLTADDGQGANNTAADTFTLTVGAVNDAPAFSVSGNVVENEEFAGNRVVTVTPGPVPVDEAGQTVTYSLSPASVAFANVALDPATGTVTITAAADQFGSQVFTLTADDAQGTNNTATDTFTLTVGAVNDVPAFSVSGDVIEDEDFAGNRVVTVTPSPVPADETGQTVTYSLSPASVAFASIALDPSTGTVTITAVADQTGSQLFTLTADDGQGVNNTATDTFTLTVSAVNDVPAFSVSGDVIEDEDFAGNRVVTVTPGPVPADETGQTVTYSLSPASVAFANVALDPATGTVTITAAAEQSGSQVFTLTADDGQGANNTASSLFTLTISNNNDPTTSGIANVAVIEDASPAIVNLFGAFDDVEDADADMSYAVVGNTNAGLFDSLIVDGVGGTLTLDFAADVIGSATLTVRATDSGGDSVETTFDINITAQSDLSIASLSPSEASPGIGREVDFTVVLNNAGPSTATDITVSVPLPAGYTYVTANNPTEYNEATGDWYRSAVGGTATLVLTAVVNATGPYDVTAEVIAANEPDPDSTPGNGIPIEDDYRTTTTTPLPVTDMLLSITVDDPIPAPNDTVLLTVTLANYGPVNATGIIVTLPPLPAQLSYENATPSAGAFDLATGVWDGFGVAWSGDPMLPFSETVDVTARVDAAVPITTVLEAVAELTSFDQYDPDVTDQDAAAMLVLGNGLDHEWVGGAGPDPTDWENPANWSSLLVPSPGDNVTIDPTANDPVLNADALSLAKLIIKTGAQVWANGFTISTVGLLDARDGPINGPGLVRLEFGKLRGTVPDLEVAVASPTAEADFYGDVTVNGDLTISQGRIDTGDHTVTVSGNLQSTGTGILLQKSGGSEVFVAGDVTFDGADYSQRIGGKFPLRDGDLRVGGDFVQSGNPHAFAAEDKHLVIFDGAGPQTVFFQNPDPSSPETDEPALSGSRFANLRIDKDAETDGAVTLLSDVVVLRRLEEPLTFVPRIDAAPGSGHVLMIGGADLDTPPFPQTRNMVFDNVPVHIFQGHNLAHLEGLVFTNMDRGVVQLRFERRDFEGPNDLVATTFETVPDFAAGGRYILFDNIHPDPTKNRTLDVLQSLPAYGEPMTEVIGNANIIWGTGTEDSDRDGILDADEYTSGTNPFLADSDGDGIDDPTELGMGTDPFDADSDGDGISDGAELAAGGDPLTPAVPGTILYVRQAPLGDDANTGFGGWGDALATNSAVEAALLNGAAPGQPFYVLYDAGVYAPLEIDSFANVSLVGSLGPGVSTPVEPPTTIFDAGSTPDVAVIRVIDSTSITIQAMTLTGASNFAGGADGSLGGGLYVNDSSTVSLTGMVIEYNEAADYGGGVYVETGGRLDLTDSRLWRNTVPSGGFGGGGIAAFGGLTVIRTIIADNQYAGGNNNGGGGGLYIEAVGDPVAVRDSQILSNFSDTNGGGIYLWDVNTPVSLFNNLIAGNANESRSGGAIFGDKLDRGSVTLIESNTVAFNRSLDDNNSAGGIHIDRADDVQLRDNIARFNVDGDTSDELQDQYLDDSGAALFEFNSFEDFGGADAFGNSDANPRFELGFYLRFDSAADDKGSQTASAAGLSLPYTTAFDGAEDAGILDLGVHYLEPADGEAYAATLIGQTADCATDTLTMQFFVAGVGADLGPGHVMAVRQDGSDTAGGTLNTLTAIRPYGWTNSELAIDEGDGIYRVAIDGVSHASGEIAVLEIKVDNDNVFELPSTDLTVLFAGEGC